MIKERRVTILVTYKDINTKATHSYDDNERKVNSY